MINALLIVTGLALLTFGGDTLVRGALALAERLGMSPLLCGLLIVGFGTSAPELAVSIDAALRGAPDIAIGNVVGSNIGNALLILGLCAMFAALPVQPLALSRDATAVILASALFVLLVTVQPAQAQFGSLQGIVLLLAFATYMTWAIRSERAALLWEQLPAEMHVVRPIPEALAPSITRTVLGLVLLITGSSLLVKGAVGVALVLGVPEVLIGLTLVAVGTSLPELTVSLLATIRGQTEVAVGNILGSNIFNLLFILGIASLVEPITVATRVVLFDQWALLGSAVLLMTFLVTGRQLSRAEGAILFALYVAYVYLGYSLFSA